MIAADPELPERARARVAELRAPLLAKAETGLPGRDAAEELERYLGDVEAATGAIAESRSRVYWLYLARRISPALIGDYDSWSARRSYAALNLALLKYGTGSSGTGLDHGKDLLTPSEALASIAPQQVQDVMTLIFMAFEHEYTALSFRRIGAGASLIVREDFFVAIADRHVDRSLKLLNKRIKQHQGFAALPGSAASLRVPAEGRPDHNTIVYPEINTEQTPLAGLRKTFNFYPHDPATDYYPERIHLHDTREVLNLFPNEVRSRLSVEPDKFFAVLWALYTAMFVRAGSEPSFAHRYLQRGSFTLATGTDREHYLDSIVPYAQEWWLAMRNEPLMGSRAKDLVRKVAATLRYRDSDLPSISIWDRRPIRIVIPGDRHEYWDLSGLQQYLGGLMQELIAGDGIIGSTKGDRFEQEVSRLVVREPVTEWSAPRELRPIHAVRDPRRKDGKLTAVREKDLGLIVADTLWIVECKAWAHPWQVLHGEYSALQTRWGQLQDGLAQAATLADMLRQQRTGSNYAVPPSIKRIDYCMCTPAAELVPSCDPAFWIQNKLPRILTPSELNDLLHRSDAAK